MEGKKRLATVTADTRKSSRIPIGLVAILCCLLLQSSAAVFGGLIGCERQTDMLYDISTVDASLSPIGNTGILSLGSLELAPDGYLYGFTTGDNSTLYKINPANASSTAIGPLNIGFIFEGSLAFAPDGTAYGTNLGGSDQPTLFTVNLNTGTANIIGTISGGSHDINGLAWRDDGMLVGLDRETNSLLAIDPASAASSVIAAVNPNLGSVGGMVVLDGTAYFSTGGPGYLTDPGSNELYSFDLFTGQHTLIGSFNPTITSTGISGLAVPEPCTLLLLGLSSLALLRNRRSC